MALTVPFSSWSRSNIAVNGSTPRSAAISDRRFPWYFLFASFLTPATRMFLGRVLETRHEGLQPALLRRGRQAGGEIGGRRGVRIDVGRDVDPPGASRLD